MQRDPDHATVVLLRRARLAGGALADVRLTDGVIGEVTPRIDTAGVDEVIDLDGRTLLPGLWDSHVHFDQWTLSRQRLDLSTAMSAAEVVSRVAKRLVERRASTATGPDVPLVGFGFRDGLWADAPHRDLLDAATGDIPVVLVAGDVHCGWLNTAALRLHGHADHPTGLLREGEWFPVMEALRTVEEDVLDRWADEAAAAAAARGVVGIVDLEAPWSLDAWTRRVQRGTRSLRVRCGVWPSMLEMAIDRGLRTGVVVAGTDGLIMMGPLKVITDGSLNTRTAYCHDPYPGSEGAEHPHGILTVPPSELLALMRRAWSQGLETAIHAIGDEANTLVLDAFEAVGAVGSVEHAQLLRRKDVGRFAALDVVASVQPQHAVDDRDVADRHWAGRTDRAFPFADLVASGARLALGSDAPVAPLDPWASIASAVHRSDDGRPPWHPEQHIPLHQALAASAGGARTPAVGSDADLVVLDADPVTATPDELRSMPVAGTLLGGRWTWRQGI